MEILSQQNQTRPYPKYLYHSDFNEPKIVNSQVEEAELGTKGWVSTYLFKAYPKWVDGKIVKSKEEEERLLASQTDPVDISVEVASASVEITPEAFDEFPPVTKEIQVDMQDTAKVVEKPKKSPGRPKKT